MNQILQKQLDAAGHAMAANGEGQGAGGGADKQGGESQGDGKPAKANGRAQTSKDNGRKGGRPEIDYHAVGNAFAVALGAPPISWRGEWFLHEPGRAYRPQSDVELGARFAKFTETAFPPLKYSVNLQRNVFGAMRKNFVENAVNMPIWLNTGKSAAGWADMRNGLLNIEAAARGEVVLQPHSPDFFGTYAFPFEYDPDAPAPLFDSYLASVQNDEESRKILLKLLGLLLVPDTSFQVFFMLAGEAGCGKSVFIKIAQAMLGRQNCCSIPLAMFGERFGTLDLTRCLANLVADSPTVDGNSSLAYVEGVLKEVACGEAIWAEVKGVQCRGQYPAMARCIFCTNYPLPPFMDRSDGIWRRMRIIPFPNRFDIRADRDPMLAERIAASELPGVFARAVRGLGWLRAENADGHFPETEEGARLVREHKEACDKEGAFLGEYCVEDATGIVETQRLYRAYAAWCGERGYGKKNAANFAADVCRVFPNVKKNRVFRAGKRSMEWHGLQFLESLVEDEF